MLKLMNPNPINTLLYYQVWSNVQELAVTEPMLLSDAEKQRELLQIDAQRIGKDHAQLRFFLKPTNNRPDDGLLELEVES